MPALQNIGNYHIEKLLGSGGMANVYLATHVLLRKKFAIKVLKSELGVRDPMMLKRFVREAQIAQQIDHPNIVKVHDVGTDPKTGQLYIVMEYVEGENLHDYSRGKHLPSQRVREIAYEMSKALAELNRLGIVHRDIKPSNIMLCKDGTIKLMDLGIAKAVHNGTENDVTLTMDQTVLGTPAFSSPEQCRDAKSVDIRSDIYCLGASLYAIATGEMPYGGTTAMEVLLKVLEEKPRPLAEIRPDLDSDLISLIESMMAKTPDKRPQTPENLLSKLETSRKSTRVLKQAGMAAIGVALLLALVFACRGVLSRNGRKTPEATVKEEQPSSVDESQEGAAVASEEKAEEAETSKTEPVSPEKQELNAGNADNSPKPEEQSVKDKGLEQPSEKNEGSAVSDVKQEEEEEISHAKKKPLKESKRHVTLSERLSDVEEKLAKDGVQTKMGEQYISTRVLALANDKTYAMAHFNEFRCQVHHAQHHRLKEQIRINEHARKIEASKFSEEATKKVQQSIRKYTKDYKSRTNQQRQNFTDELLKQLRTGKVNPNAEVEDLSDSEWSGPLLYTLMSGRFQGAELLMLELLKLGADANKAIERMGNTMTSPYLPLFYTSGGIDVLEGKLLAFLTKADGMNLKDKKRHELINDLVLLNHDVREVDRDGNTALHYAAGCGYFDTVVLLVASGAEVNARNNNGETPFSAAVKSYQPAIQKLLLKLGADSSI